MTPSSEYNDQMKCKHQEKPNELEPSETIRLDRKLRWGNWKTRPVESAHSEYFTTNEKFDVSEGVTREVLISSNHLQRW